MKGLVRDIDVLLPDHWSGERLRRLLAWLESGLVERRREVRLILLCALAGEHTLLIGPPGTAKSELARRLHRVFRGGRYFERLLTRFSVPEELFGPLSISALEQDRYERHTAGFLPDASIAFIDEVFKANSAILNALLTLLNEREFDNGAGRMLCPLISVIGATNEVPDDEVGEAFFDRFLLRLRVSPVSEAGFRNLLATVSATASVARGESDDRREDVADALEIGELHALRAAAAAVELPAQVLSVLVELRAWLIEQRIHVSDRRWVKVVGLLRTAAAAERRASITLWDLWLLPWCVAADGGETARVEAWLDVRIGLAAACLPEYLTRLVEAFEAQLVVEREANDLDYDESGRLRFSTDGLADAIGDAKGGARALRLTAARRRRYGETHVRARTAQIDDAVARASGYVDELGRTRQAFEGYAEASVWMDPPVVLRIRESLATTARVLDSLTERLHQVRAGFECLPRLLPDPGIEPEAVSAELPDQERGRDASATGGTGA